MRTKSNRGRKNSNTNRIASQAAVSAGVQIKGSIADVRHGLDLLEKAKAQTEVLFHLIADHLECQNNSGDAFSKSYAIRFNRGIQLLMNHVKDQLDDAEQVIHLDVIGKQGFGGPLPDGEAISQAA